MKSRVEHNRARRRSAPFQIKPIGGVPCEVTVRAVTNRILRKWARMDITRQYSMTDLAVWGQVGELNAHDILLSMEAAGYIRAGNIGWRITPDGHAKGLAPQDVIVLNKVPTVNATAIQWQIMDALAAGRLVTHTCSLYGRAGTWSDGIKRWTNKNLDGLVRGRWVRAVGPDGEAQGHKIPVEGARLELDRRGRKVLEAIELGRLVRVNGPMSANKALDL